MSLRVHRPQERPQQVEGIAGRRGKRSVVDDEHLFAAPDHLRHLVAVDHLQIVVEILTRNLPVFLARPTHDAITSYDEAAERDAVRANTFLDFLLDRARAP